MSLGESCCIKKHACNYFSILGFASSQHHLAMTSSALSKVFSCDNVALYPDGVCFAPRGQG